ncbi:MAG: hypothetical protein LBV50_04255 [Novosphingobium sp.]|nr:hypothetical protein [Novosphingobium sp.]
MGPQVRILPGAPFQYRTANADCPPWAAARVRSSSDFDPLLVGHFDALDERAQVLAAALGALLPAVENAGQRRFQPLGL